MAFPHNDPNWESTAQFIRSHWQPEQAILAPDDFWRLFDTIFRYQNSFLRPSAEYDWVVIHKGLADRINPPVLKRITEGLKPVFANEVFVVLATDPRVEALNPENDHVKALYGALPQLLAASTAQAAAKLEPPPFDPTEVPSRHVMPDQGLIKKMSAMEREELAAAMNAFFLQGGYEYVTLRDQVYDREIDRVIDLCVGDADGQKVLDLCCGNNRRQNHCSGASGITGVDISTVAIEQARGNAPDPRYRFIVGDAHDLKFPDAHFDLVLFVDSSEHVHDIEQVLSEIARVLKPGGTMFLTAANRNGLNQILSRKLGTGEFVTNSQHIREFTYAEMRELLAASGFREEAAHGIFLYPYWGVPGVDEYVRPITDNDPELVETLRVLGERAGPEYAYIFAMLVRKI